MKRRTKKKRIGIGELSPEQWERQYRHDAAQDRFREIEQELEVFGLNLDPEDIVNDTVEFALEFGEAYPEFGMWLAYHHREVDSNFNYMLIEPNSSYPWARLFIEDLNRMDLSGLEINGCYEVDSLFISNPDLSRVEAVEGRYIRNAIGSDYAIDCYEYGPDDIIPCFRRHACYIHVSVDREPKVEKGTRVFRSGVVLRGREAECAQSVKRPFGAVGTVISRKAGKYGDAIKVRFDNEKEAVTLDRSQIGGILDGDWS